MTQVLVGDRSTRFKLTAKGRIGMKIQFLAPRLLWLVAALAIPTAMLFGQAITGDLVGTVTDATGAVVPGTAVTAQNDETGVKTRATAGSGGEYRFTNLAVGNYTLTASATGFTTATVKGVRVQLNNTLTQNFALQVGSTATTVEVSAGAATIDTTTAQVQTTYEARQALDLPTASFTKVTGIGGAASIFNLSLLGAGVASSGGVGQGTGPAIAGQRPEDNTFYIDGVSNNNHYSTGPLVYISNEAVAELSILQNQFSAEFGGASGGVFNAIVKAGTNQVHGSLYEFLQNRNLNAVDSLNYVKGITTNPRFDSNRFGATIGGPIIKDKLFYFGDFEYSPVGQSSPPGSPIQAPTAAGLSALGNVPGVNKTNLGVFQKYVPVAASANAASIKVGGVTIPVGTLAFPSPNFNNSYAAIVSVDYNLSEKDQLRGRFIYNKQSGLDANANLPIFFASSPNTNNLGSFSEFHNFTPTLQNEFRVSFSRNNQAIGTGNFSFPGLSVFPNITIDDLASLQIGPDPNTPTGSVQNLFQAQDNISKTFGRHTFKGGYHFTDVILTNFFIQRARGDYEYSTLQQFLLDLTPDILGERSAGPLSYPVGFLEHAAFFNDDFRIRPNLTINLGVRYEYATIPIASRYQKFSAPASVPGGITFAEPKPSPNEWSPRIGFAYSPGDSGVWSIRAGFSRAYDLSYANLTSNAAPPYFQTTQDVNLTSNAPNFLANGGLQGGGGALPTNPRAALGVVGSYTFGDKRPYGLTWTASVQRQFAKDYTFEARYVGTKGVHLWNQSRLNISPQVTPTNFIPTFFTLPSAATFASLTRTLAQVKSYIVPGGTAARPYDVYAAVGSLNNFTGYAPQAYSQYHGLALQLNRRYSKNLSYIAAYTWSHLIDDATATNFSTYLTPRRAQDFMNLAAEKSTSALDHRHRFTFTPIYDWKAFGTGSWFLKNIVSNWNISGTYTYQSPELATVQSNVDSNLNNDSAGDRSIINPDGSANLGTGVTGYNAQGQVAASSGTIVAYVAKNANARYVVAGSGALANGGRNTFPLKPTNNIDLSVLKRFNFTERVRFDIGCQFFNLLNHPQFTGGYLSDVNSNGFTGARNDLVPSDPLFGRFDQFYSSNSRQLQVVARFVF